MNEPTVSVLIPVFNGIPYIHQTIKSVLLQSFPDWELIIADNASTDGTVNAIKSFKDPRIRLIQHSQNLGMVRNWDYLIQLTAAKYACVLGADDVFAPNHLERKVRLLEENPTASYVHGAIHLIDFKGNQLPPDNFDCAPIEYRQVTLPRFLKVNFANITSILIRVSTLREHKLGFESRYSLMMDWPLELKLAMLGGPIAYDEEPTASYRLHPASVARNTIQSFEWLYQSLRLRVDALIEYPAVWREIGIDPLTQSRSLTKDLWRLAFQQMRRGHFQNAQRAWRMFREFNPVAEVLVGLPEYLRDGVGKLSGQNKLT